MTETVRLTIDGREVEVPRGATLLEAAKKLGICVPTLCHLEGAAPLNSCYVCLVHVEGDERLSPACSTPVRDGMVVSATSEEVRDARRTALELLLSEHYGDCEGPCTVACPASLDVPAMIDHLTAGKPAEAVAVARERLLFNAVLGRICPRFCERACRRGQLDEAVAIAELQRFTGDVALRDRKLHAPRPAESSGKKVAVVGAGPAGLSAAYYLLLKGHGCTLFDAHKRPGGMLRHAIPDFRLPKAVLDGEIDVVRRLGGEFQMRTRLGEDVSLDELRGRFDAVLLATGAALSTPPACEGAENTRAALDFLFEVNAGKSPYVGKTVVVLGGGDLALDAARSAVRLGAENVDVFCEKPRERMGCSDERIEAAEAEGVRLRFERRVSAVRQLDNRKRRVVVDEDGALFPIDADVVIAAGERTVEVSFHDGLALEVTKKGIAADARTFTTSIEGVFAAGECVSGADHAVRAAADGHDAATAIDQYVKGDELTGEVRPFNVHMGRFDEDELAIVRSTADGTPRVAPPLLPSEQRRTTFDEVSAGLTPEEALGEARRCVRCACAAKDDCKLRQYAAEYGARPGRFRGERRKYARHVSHPEVVYEPNKCILCGLCVRVARESGEKLGVTFLGRGFAATVGVPFEQQLAEGLKVSAKRCVAVCPTGALAFKRPVGSGATGG